MLQFNNAVVPFFSSNSEGDIQFAPTSEDAEGFYPIRILMSKVNYAGTTNMVNFLAEITIDQGGPVQSLNDPVCNDATFDLNGAYALDVDHLWGDTVATETPAFSPFLAVSTCTNLQIFYHAEYFNSATNSWELLSQDGTTIGNEISFDANQRTFTIDKCSSP